MTYSLSVFPSKRRKSTLRPSSLPRIFNTENGCPKSGAYADGIPSGSMIVLISPASLSGILESVSVKPRSVSFYTEIHDTSPHPHESLRRCLPGILPYSHPAPATPKQPSNQRISHRSGFSINVTLNFINFQTAGPLIQQVRHTLKADCKGGCIVKQGRCGRGNHSAHPE